MRTMFWIDEYRLTHGGHPSLAPTMQWRKGIMGSEVEANARADFKNFKKGFPERKFRLRQVAETILEETKSK